MVITETMIRRNHETSLSTVMVGPAFELPFDLVYEILIRSSVKSILRFKSVCKTWHELIENPNFTKKYHTRSKNLNPNLSSLLVTDNDYVKRRSSMWLHPSEKAHNPNPHPNPSVIFDFPNPCIILSILDGLVWAELNYSESIICNPTTGRIRKIQPSSLAKLCMTIAFYGIGFKDNEYKLFTIVHPKSPSELVVRADMYSMSTNLWRSIDVKIGEFDARLLGYCDMMAVIINDVFYWGAFDYKNQYMVTYFDMKSYICGVMKAPGYIGFSWKVIDFKGELAVTNCLGASTFNLWSLNEKERSWTMKLRVEGLRLEGLILKCLGCESNGNLVMEQRLSYSKRVFSYPENDIMYLPSSSPLQHYLYTESLLWV